MVNKREIKRLKKEFERLIKRVGLDNLSSPEVLEKSLELEKMMYDYCSEYRSMMAQKSYVV